MINIKDLQLLVSLAHHRHFSRAASDCGITQPAFSARLRKMEADFELPLVRRGNKFLGFTSEGEVVLKWARRILTGIDGMRQEIDAAKNDLRGKLVVGTIPTALPFAGSVAAHLRRAHANLSIEIQSLSSTQIAAGLDDFTLDAGITYLDDLNPSSDHDVTEMLYDERYVLIAPKGLAPRASGNASWAEAAALPLCLLTTNMRNRQFVDATFAQIGATPTVVMETNGFTAAMAQIASGSAATIAPLHMAESLFGNQKAVMLDLVKPEVTHSIGLIVKPQNLVLPVVQALRYAAKAAL